MNYLPNMGSYLPDSIYTICGGESCNVCSNKLYSPVVGGMVHDSQRGKVLCPFGMGSSMNQPVFGDQGFINSSSITKKSDWGKTTWGHVPQLDPRSLTSVGLEWRTT